MLKLFWIPAGELIHSGQGCNAFTEGCSMGGLDPNKSLCSVSSRLEWIHLKKKKKKYDFMYQGEIRMHICDLLHITAEGKH